MTVLYK